MFTPPPHQTNKLHKITGAHANDYRAYLLPLLSKLQVQFSLNVAIPKNLTTSDREWNASQPIFTTSDQHIVPLINGKIDYGETDQMNKRWKEEGNWLLIMSLCQMLCSFLYKNSAPIYILYVLKLYKNTKFCSYTYLYILQL